ncbi:unnamed protein product (macronuclear) [Paramecium tetraurelia]|uniref:MORN repeat protein n=1 Tax=Paramecium tetraurelia TaxID=5888 RepID=A0D2J4_PARTE|nr:uncharacterized protein GSPATT00012769001 [Paramecium tetraurelia]CAK77261.1 unnamed protein product [Paramecium tetraurelia]|eukprot:XP_001444658.1 hypothetical protein (macronuclear) [Paramecium tetraurelia strain d4-2]
MGSCQICNGFQIKEIKIQLTPEIMKKEPTLKQIILIQARFRGMSTRKRVQIKKQKENINQPHQNSLNEDPICYEQAQHIITDRSTVAQQQEDHVVISIAPTIRNSQFQFGSTTGFDRLVMEDGYQNKIIIVVTWKAWYRIIIKNKWLDGFMNGEGLYSAPDGTYYRGQWKDSYMNGQGTYFNSTQNIRYEGEWQYNLQHGEGIETYADKSVYKGTFKNGLKDGHGQFVFNDGSFYEGQFQEDKFDGLGKFVWDSGQKVYYGEWFKGKKQGFGQLEVKGTYTFEGQFKNGLKNGIGKIIWSDGRKYNGEWQEGKQHGIGTFQNRNGEIFSGVWKFGLIQSH